MSLYAFSTAAALISRMNLDHYKDLLLQRQNELTDDVKRYDEEVLDSKSDEVGDSADSAVSDQQKSQSADLSSTATGELAMVQAALKRIEEGTYGICIDCEETIPESRLNAVPWTPYCVKDQQAHEGDIAKPATL